MKTVRRLITAAIIGFVLGVFDRDYHGAGIAIGLVLLALWWLYLIRIDKKRHDSVTSGDTIAGRPPASHLFPAFASPYHRAAKCRVGTDPSCAEGGAMSGFVN